MVDGWRPQLAGLLHPWICLCCGEPGAAGLDLCRACRAELPVLADPCPLCALPRARGECRHCLNRPSPFAAAWIPFRYAFPIDRLIIGLKFDARLERGRLLGTLLATAIAPQLCGASRPSLLVPVPLHPTRQTIRGFNQAAELARPLAARLGLSLAPGAVVRVRATAEQSTLAARERRRNLHGAFAVVGTLPAHVAIIDDVVTTGATAAALADALHAAGVAQVTLIAAARAV